MILPPATELTRAQHSGWACVWCTASLQAGGVPAGRAEGRSGAHDLSVQVYACTRCAQEPNPARRIGG
ncbi:hypothetical protein GCM10018980_52190 [Streptomyces capoamus]|uniref:Uncharacterized protein n=1 Tax=Streptomyces capoamus TaxID=68183 RepID=A0A919KE53_9ACTN|nr:hypothetical protein GCM10010501_28630 [Streptomyces libani subsp. rufus]GHG62320.1 hypothetical protein GCM10018980_52190 [Streptomyces capoamus]